MSLYSSILSGLLSLTLTTVCAEDLITSRAVLQDKAGTLTIEQVVAADFQPAGLILSKGYTDTVHWLRLRVKAQESNDSIEMRIRPTYLDEVQLYEPDTSSPNGWKLHVTGDRYAFSDHERAAITLGFVIYPVAPETIYYLRLKTSSTSLLNVEVLTSREAKFKDLYLDLSQVLYLGIMLWLLFWAFNDYIKNRQTVVAWFLLYQFSYILYDLSVMGYLAPIITSELPRLGDHLTSVLVLGTVGFSIIFHRTLFQHFAAPTMLLRTLDALLLLLPFELAMLVWGNSRLALQVNGLVILLVAILYLALALTARQDSPPGRRALRIVYTLHSFSLVVSMLPILGLVEAIEWNLHSTLIHGLISGSLMFSILHLRSRSMAQAGRQAQLELALARQHLELERAQKEEQNRFIKMLTHELKTPLSVLRMVMGTSMPTEAMVIHGKRAVRDMNSVIEHCAQVDKLEGAAHELHFTDVFLMNELDDLRCGNSSPERIKIQSQFLPALHTDAQALHIILNNLIDNALKYSPPESFIEIIISESNTMDTKFVQISVENLPSVAGWPDAEKVFQKYYRSPAAHHQIGTGLGLYLIENMARKLGGKVEYSPDNTHIRFILWLPV